jgi:hypothetical protein
MRLCLVTGPDKLAFLDGAMYPDRSGWHRIGIAPFGDLFHFLLSQSGVVEIDGEAPAWIVQRLKAHATFLFPGPVALARIPRC